MREAPEYVRPLVVIIIAAIAKECNREPDDFSQGLHHMLQKFGEECFERGVEFAHDRPTVETPVFEPDTVETPVLEPDELTTPHRGATLPLGITHKK